jgi:ribonuclease G
VVAVAPVDEPVAEPPAAVAVAPVDEPVVEPPAAVPMAPVAEPEPEAAEPVDEPGPEAVAEPEEAPVAWSAESEVETAGITEAEALEEEAGTGEGPAEAEAEAESSGEAGETIMEDEGPEPARIPTSLTATLREQGPRYQHRVSRRMRRKGRDGRGPAPEGGIAEPTRPQAPPESRPPQEPRPEQRTVQAPRSAPEPRSEKASAPSISDLLKEGQEIIVQIAKEPLGQKGARITSHIALPGRFLVYMPTVDHIGVSRKIPSDDERLRL